MTDEGEATLILAPNNCQLDSLTAVIKISERCNLSCDYCYYYQGNAKRWQRYPAYISAPVAIDIANFLITTAEVQKLKILQISLHGGEPMLTPIDAVEILLATINQQLNQKLDLRICIQSNATKLTDAWLKLCSKYNIQIGISVDGNDAKSNQYRRLGNGSIAFPAIEAGFKKVSEYYLAKKCGQPHLLCVVAPTIDAEAFFKFCNKYHIGMVDFLLPDYHHDTFPNNETSALAFGHALVRLFKYWLRQWPQIPKVRLFTKTLARILDSKQGQTASNGLAITIRSNGEFQEDDTFINLFESSRQQRYHVKSDDLTTLYHSDQVKLIRQGQQNLAKKCQKCQWLNQCQGGELIHRYQRDTGFANPSVYCQGLAYFYQQVDLFSKSFNLQQGAGE